ncbi:uncharacterized protein LOC119374286 [Rhipicephalus sanguineus]|uniref:uncharacterized protein LOC119374286 n=1 Tax=Rhipicephalus sanguineus TaxID=34632 RepID=UPI001895B92B|nr:uncharacterized protein LOC119374286 [Rhipicephalus sanguineus]
MFVYVEYTPSLKTAVVEHTRIHCSPMERFNPKDVNDFSRARTYYVRSCHKDRLYEAIKVIHITGTLEEMAMFRANRPRLADVGREDFDREMRDTRPPLCKDREHIREEERQQQIDDALNNYKLEHQPMGASTDLQQRLLAMEKELERLRQEGKRERPSMAVGASDSIFKSAYADLDKRYRKMQTDFKTLKSNHEQLMKRFEDRNRAILEADEKDLESNNSANDVRHRTPSPQRNGVASKKEGSVRSNTASDVGSDTETAIHGLMWQHSSPGHLQGDESKKDDSVHSNAASDVEPEPAEPDNDQEINGGGSDSEENTKNDSTSPKIGSVGQNGKIYAGSGFWIDKKDWSKLFSTPTDTRFCKYAALLFWTPEELRVRSVTGTPSNRYLSSGKDYSRLPLTPEKLATLKGLFRHYVGKDVLAQRRLKAARQHLSSVLCSIRRTLEEMATFRAKRPRRTDVGREDFDEEVHGARPPLCKDRAHIREEERQQQIDDALNNYKLEHAPKGVVTDLLQRLLAMEKELERLRQEGKKERPSVSVNAGDSVPKSVHVDLVKQYKKMETDFRILKSNHEQLMRRFEDRNRAILEADESIFESKNSASDVRHRTPSPQRIVEPQSAEPDNDEEMNSSSDSEESTRTDSKTPKIGSVGENGKLYAGRGFWIDKQDWAKLFSAPTDFMFSKFAASLFWTKEELRARSVTGTISNRALSSGKYSSRLPLTPEKLTTLKGLFRHYVGKDALAQQRLKAVRRHLANALCDVRRPTTRRPSSSGRASQSLPLLESSAASSPVCDDESIDDLDLGDGQSKLDSSQCEQDLGKETIIGSSRGDGEVTWNQSAEGCPDPREAVLSESSVPHLHGGRNTGRHC